jgi:putative membrane protein
MTTADHLVTSVPRERAKEELDIGTRLALVRTRLAFERTLMAWVRTSVSLITFGFTLFKAVQYLVQHEAPGLHTYTLRDARMLGLLMVAIGVIALMLATVQHLRHAQRGRALDPELPVISVAAVVAALFCAIGFWLLIRMMAA